MTFVILNTDNKKLTKFQKIILCNVVRRQIVHPKDVKKKTSYNAIVKLIVQDYLKVSSEGLYVPDKKGIDFYEKNQKYNIDKKL